jgi:hypothetical protein
MDAYLRVHEARTTVNLHSGEAFLPKYSTLSLAISPQAQRTAQGS